MRRGLAFALVTLPFVGALGAHGCGSDEPPVEDLCGWLSDPDNCYRSFHRDVESRCGKPGRGSAPTGTFLLRDTLDQCILDEGGVVLFDPPLVVSSFPVKKMAFKITASDATECGAGSFDFPDGFSITVNGFPPDGGTVAGEGGGGGGGGEGGQSGAGGTQKAVTGGTFSNTPIGGGRRQNVMSCPGGESHRFNDYQVVECREYESLYPRAEVESSAGALRKVGGEVLGVPGFVRFRVYYPPQEGELRDAEPEVVEYFDCAIPAPPEPCVDGAQNGGETDVDCGGPVCEARCQAGQKCAKDTDCDSGLVCSIVAGIKKCSEGPAGGGGAGTGGSGGG